VIVVRIDECMRTASLKAPADWQIWQDSIASLRKAF
jgi:hypothetical protein